MVTDTRTLTYDAAGRLITLDDTRHDLGFDYDDLGRLTDFTASGSAPLPASQYFTYDENGNRESITESGTPYSYTNVTYSNRLTSATGPTAKSFTYDAAGNVTNDGIHSYGYDDRGRLVSVDSGSVTYQHNGQGQRVKKDDGSAVRLFAYDEAGQLIGEYDRSANAIQETVWFNGMPVAVLKGSSHYYVHTDHLETPRIITDGNAVIWRWESDSFGTTVAQEDPDGDLTDFTYNLRFPGQYYDEETGFHYNYHRTYDPSTGRYLESDPIGLGGGLNTYGYALQNPLSYTDAFGLAVEQCGDDEDCTRKCLDTYYGTWFDRALSASPFSFASVALDQAARITDDALSRQANRLKYEATKPISYSKQSRADRLLRTLRQFRVANAIAGVTAAAAGGFVIGAGGYCALQCLGSQ